MKIGTFSVVVGTAACDAACPFCVSKMTAQNAPDSPEVNWRNFHVGRRFAKDSGVSTMLLTGKGEPLLYPKLIKKYLQHSYETFPFIELQTNGIRLFQQVDEEQIKSWYQLGLTLVCLSIVDWQSETNTKLMRHKGVRPNNLSGIMPIWDTVRKLHDVGLSVRLNCTMIKGGIDNHDSLENLIDKCQIEGVEQLTFRDVTTPSHTHNQKVTDWVEANRVDGNNMVWDYLQAKGAHCIMTLPHGASIFDLNGQNICVNNCLTGADGTEEIRQLIFFPDGHLRYDWRYEGAIIL